ncbi:mediator of RNA polymerase II transcription subunit 15a-like isoform X2 [Lycium barbarum]|uniref:mediator of RNA polymerase II transcription subunit 15a-like isoform X2 n=1 Tax=Lycium barbarum TaxID=112863 RepID=UPI00293E6A96|nr:mediator of RNA polymerase II transcription subunit 15a-like isoform X2 [Lycium barbarum]
MEMDIDQGGEASLDSTAQMGNANAADWQEEVYQKINSMKQMFLSELNDIYQKIASKVQQYDSLPRCPQHEQIEKLKMFKMLLERIVLFLGLNKHDIQLSHKEKLFSVEQHISFFLSSNSPRKPTSSPQQQQLFHGQQLMQQQLIAQQNQLMGQQNTMPDVQQRLAGQQNNYNSIQQQQQLINQQNNFQNMHQQQLGSQINIAGIQQQQLSGSQQPCNSGLRSNQHPIYMLQQSKLPVQQQMLQSTTTLLPSQAQSGNANAADWQEEVYQKIKSMKEMYLSELNDLYQKIATKVQQHDSLPQRPQNEQIEKLKMFKMTLERIVLFLRLNKHEIQLSHKEKLLSVEKHISFFLSYNRPRKPASSTLQEQLPQSSMHTSQAQNTYAGQTSMMGASQQDIASEFERLLSLID